MIENKKVRNRAKVAGLLGVCVLVLTMIPIAEFRESSTPLSLDYLGITNSVDGDGVAAIVVLSNTAPRTINVSIEYPEKFEQNRWIPGPSNDADFFDIITIAPSESKPLRLLVSNRPARWRVKVMWVQQRSGPLGVWDVFTEKYRQLIKGRRNAKRFNGSFDFEEIVFTTSDHDLELLDRNVEQNQIEQEPLRMQHDAAFMKRFGLTNE